MNADPDTNQSEAPVRDAAYYDRKYAEFWPIAQAAVNAEIDENRRRRLLSENLLSPNRFRPIQAQATLTDSSTLVF
jgi:hypothetical protein